MNSSDSLGTRILSGIAWKAASQITLQLTRTVVALVLARMLAPHDWGLAAMVLVFSGFVLVFTDNAFGTALIQRRDVTETDRSTVFWISAGAGLLLAICGVVVAEPLASFYGEPDVRELFVALSVGILVTSLGTTHMAVLVREMSFRRLEIRQIGATVVGGVVGISLAVSDVGAWAIAGQMLSEAASSTILLWLLTPWRPSRTVSVASVRKLGSFAGNVFAENLLWQGGRTLGFILIGRLLGAAALGTYTLATTVILMPFSRLAAPLQQVFFPAFSQITDDPKRMADIWIRTTRLVGAFAIPALLGLMVLAADFVPVVMGSQWASAVLVIQILAIVGIIQALHTLNGEVLQALGQVRVLVRLTALSSAVGIASTALGAHWGIVGASTGIAAGTCAVEPLRALVTTRALDISFWTFTRSFLGVIQASAGMVAVIILARSALLQLEISAALRLAVLVPLGALAYLVGAAWRCSELVDEISAVTRRRRVSVESTAMSEK